MLRPRTINLSLLICVLGVSAASAYEGNWKRGRVYYRGVCTECHTSQKGAAIAPNAYTRAEWAAYLQSDKHAGGKDSVKQYVSAEHRAGIKGTNKVAEKFADVPDQELLDDIKAFVDNGAKDGDAPAGCN